MTTTMTDIETRAHTYAEARETLADEVRALEDELETTKRARLTKIKRALAEAQAAHADLQAAIEGAPGLFEKPRTRVLHGIKVGIQKGKGKLTWADERRVIDRIHERMPELADTLIKCTEKPVKKALEQLDSKQLRTLGITVADAGDQIVIRPMDSDIDRLIDALFRVDELRDEATA